MFKKTIIAALSASFLASVAFADSTNFGIRLSATTLEASGTETTDQATTVTQKEQEANFTLPSIFVERSVDINTSFSMVVGLDFVPLTAEIDKLGGGDGTDATISAGNLITAYLQPTFSVNENTSIFGKVGYAMGDLMVDDITRQTTTASQTGDTASTEKSTDKDLEGTVLGIGVQINQDSGLFNFVRLEATQTDFDRISHTNSNSKKLTADSEMELMTISFGKSF